MGKAGRKRLAGVPRRKDGTPKQRVEDNTVQVQRQRIVHFDVPPQDAHKDLAGFPLGRMWLARKITERMFNAGQAWAKLRWRHAQIMGLMLPLSRCIDWQGPGGRSLAAEPDESEVRDVRSRLRRWFKALGNDQTAIRELDTVCVADREPNELCMSLFKSALRTLDMASKRG